MENITLAPICLFTYNRLQETKNTVETLQNNFLAKESKLFIFSDGPKDDASSSKVNEVRDYIRTIEGFETVEIFESPKNKGLANSIISGVSSVIKQFGSVIVVEDDLILSHNFLVFMNQSLQNYKNEQNVFSVSGYCLKVKPPQNYLFDMFFWGRAHSWGWATWQDRWDTIDWDIKDWNKFKEDKKAVSNFNAYGTDLFSMLKNSMEGKVNSWFIRFTYNQFKQNKLTVYPLHSKVINKGFIEESTHCNTYNRNTVYFDTSNLQSFKLSNKTEILPTFRKQLFHYKSYSYRIVGKILTIMMQKGLIKQNSQKI